MKIEKVELDDETISDNTMVTVKEMGNVVEIMYNSNQNRKARTIKLSEDEYYNVNTGEILEYKSKSENKAENTSSVSKTMKRIKELIQTNVVDVENVRFCTFTYRENMTDTEKLYNDFRKFNQRFQRYIKKQYHCGYEYIVITEPQGRGAWHLHALYIFPKKNIFIENKVLSSMWQHGFTKITKLDGIENVAVYLMAYLSDVEISEDKLSYFSEDEIKHVETYGVKKHVVKGARLKMYPSNFNIVRHSKGIKYPEKKEMTMKLAKELVKDKTLKFHTTYKLSNDDYMTIIDKKEYR